MKTNNKSTVKSVAVHLAVIFALVFIAEIFICNYKHFLSLPEQQFDFNPDELRLVGLLYDSEENCFKATQNDPTIEITDINSVVKTIYADVDWPDEKRSTLDIQVYYTDETRLSYVSYGKELQVVKGFERSKYLQEDFNGKSERIKLKLLVSKGEKLYIGQIGINKQIPFVFSLARVGTMLLITLGIYSFVMLFRYRNATGSHDTFCHTAKCIATMLFALLVLTVYGGIFSGFLNATAQDHGSQISQELVDAFLNGRVSLLAQPSDELLNTADPYVPANRGGIDYLWDHVYYNGQYYSYYGITPVIMLFIPFHLITGMYMYDGFAVLLFSLISILFISLAYYKFIKRLCPDTPLYLQLFGQVILLMSCGILSNIVRPAFYEVATSCAFMCLSIALYHLACSGILQKSGTINMYHTIFMSFWTALAVLARATFALYAVCAVVTVTVVFIERRADIRGRTAIKYFACALLPLVCFGLVQCIYNYMRFGNIFEFGIKYSLTINDFTKTDFHFSFAFVSLYNFLFGIPSVNDSMYFIHPDILAFGASGYYFFETYTAIGLFTRVPLLYSLFALPFAKTNMKFKDKLLFALKYILPCVIVPIVIVMVTWESGFAIRYYSDFAPLMLLFVLMLFFKLYQKNASDDFRQKTYATVFGVTALLAFVGAMAVINSYVPNFGRHIGCVDYSYTHKYYRIARELSFWY